VYFNLHKMYTRAEYHNLGVAVGVNADGMVVINEGNINNINPPGYASGGTLTPAQALEIANWLVEASVKAPEVAATYAEGVGAERYVAEARKSAIDNIINR
jgi:hypothetical protein